MNQSIELALLEIERRLNASREAVFSALTEPAMMNQWFFGGGCASAEVEQDFRVGGKYVVNMFAADGTQGSCGNAEKAEHAPHGEYLEIDPPRKLVFTWISEGFVDHSVVTIELEEDAEGTILKLRHSLPTQVVEPHREGWTACMANLTAVFEKEE